MDKEKRVIIKKGLKTFYGSIPMIAERSKDLQEGGYSEAHIRDVINGRKRNPKILLLAAKVLLELKQKKKAVENEIDGLMQQIESL